MRTAFFSLLLLIFAVSLSACQEEAQKPIQPEDQVVKEQVAAEQASAATEEQHAQQSLDQAEQQRPSPPVFENFQGEPQLSLFPRVGDYQPDPGSERHPYWRTFIDHLVKVTGVAENQENGSRGWVFRSINSIDSLGYFSPLHVKPNQTYQVSFKLRAELHEEATAGIGVLEFDEFLWIGEQYTEETFKKHYRGVHEGRRLSGKPGGTQSFTFTTGPETNMIHLVLFREGPHDRNSIMFDDISVK